MGVGSVMCSYNKVNGTYACENDKVGISIHTYEKHITSGDTTHGSGDQACRYLTFTRGR